MRCVRRKLHEVFVCGKDAAHASFFFAYSRKSCHNIVSLKAVAAQNRKAERAENVLNPRKLCAQVIGRLLSCCLVLVVHFVAECRSARVECGYHIMRIKFLEDKA